MNRLDVTYERTCMTTPKEKHYTKMLEIIVDYNDRNNAPYPMRSFDKQSVKSWQKRKMKNLTPAVTPIT